jgi:hypothetical protein
VLHLLANQIDIFIANNQIAMVQRSGLFNQITNKKHWFFQPPLVDSYQSKETQIDILTNQVSQQLSTWAQVKRSFVNVTLGSDLVRFTVLPAQNIWLNDTEKMTYAKAILKEQFGPVSNQWIIQCQDVPPSQPTVVAAIDSHWLLAMQSLTKQHQLKLAKLQPHMIFVFNKFKSHFKEGDIVLAIVEDTRLVLMQIQNGAIMEIRNCISSTNLNNDLNTFLARELMVSEKQTHQLFLYAPNPQQSIIKVIQPWHVNRLILQHKKIKDSAFSELEIVL